ncbi:MAG TPA: TolC family protein [Bacteroidetes bacterium]|nr:TolC family protein [Bacteroidota bacterium]
MFFSKKNKKSKSKTFKATPKSIIKAGFTSLFICFVLVGQSQSLETLLNDAAANNLQLKILNTEYLAALERAPQVNELPDPEASIGAFPFPVETRLGGQITRISATQMFPWPGTLDSKKDLELAKAKALYERIEARKLNLFYEIKKPYFRLYEIQQSQKIIRRNIAILEALERLALTKVESGKATAADVLRVQLKTEELKQELDILESAKTSPTASINQLLNRPLETEINITDSLSFVNIPFNKNELTENIKANHPILQMFELQQEISRQAISLNELNGKPSFGAGMDYITVRKRSDAEPSGNGRDILQLRASIKIPLYRNKYSAKEREEELKIAALEDRKADVLLKYRTAIEKAFAESETARLKTELYAKQIEITQAAINILEASYSTQGRDFDELLRLEKELVDYDLKILKAVVQSHIAKAKVERYVAG